MTNELYHNDCLIVLDQLIDTSVHLVLADFPYYIMTGTDLVIEGRSDIVQNAEFDHVWPTYEEYIHFVDQCVEKIVAKMCQHSSFYGFFATQYLTDLIRICEKYGLVRKNILVWYKTNPCPHIRKSNYLSAFESVVFMVKGYPTFNFTQQENMHNCLIYPVCAGHERIRDPTTGKVLHPTQKPESVIENLIEVSSNKGDMVLDPFAGMGTVNVVCKKLGRHCIGIEKDETFYNAAQKRLTNTKIDTKKLQTVQQYLI